MKSNAKSSLKILLALLCGIAVVGIAAAQDQTVRDVITFQGVLRNADGSTVADGPHDVRFEFFNTEFSTTITWWEEQPVTTEAGVFTVKLGENNAFVFVDFSKSQWLEMELLTEGTGPLPRLELTPTANAIMARSVPNQSITSIKLAQPAVSEAQLFDGAVTTAKLAPGAAVTSLNAMTGRVTLAEGTNVTIIQVDTTLVISAAGGAGGDDGDWTVGGDDLYRPAGRVFVGYATPLVKAITKPPLRGVESADKDPGTVKMAVLGDNEGLFAEMRDLDTLANSRAAVFGRRTSSSQFHAIGFGPNDSKTAVTGYNDWGNNYTFGVAGYSWLDFPYSGGVLGANNNGSLWASLAYKDASSVQWGIYTPFNTHVGGLAEIGSFRMTSGAVAGHVLTSDATGNATWQAPAGGGGDDGDWTISGADVYRSSEGVVAIGTDTPIGHVANETHFQVAADQSPSMSLDAIGGLNSRWLFANYAPMGQLWIAHDAGSGANAVMIMNTNQEVGLGTSPQARLHVKGGHPDLDATDGDFWIGDTGTALRVGTSANPADGSVNMRVMGSYAGHTLNLGIDDHTVASVSNDAIDFYGNESSIKARLWSGDGGMDLGGELQIWGTGPIATIELDGYSGSGGGNIDVRGFDGVRDVGIAGGNSGGVIQLYNELGNATVTIDGQYGDGYGRIVTQVLEITGGADLSEQFEISSPLDWALEPGMVVSIDPDHAGVLEVCRKAYDRRVAGVISGAGGVRPGMLMGQSGSVADGEHPVALTGRVYVYADASEGAIEPGDLLTTSATPGHAKKVTDHAMANGAVLGKAMTALDNGRGLVLVLVSLQ